MIFAEQIAERGADILRAALQAEPGGHAHHRADGLRVLAEVYRLAERQPRIEIVQRQRGAGEAFDQSALDGRQLVGAAEVVLDIADEAIERLRRGGAAVEPRPRQQLRFRRPMPAARRPRAGAFGRMTERNFHDHFNSLKHGFGCGVIVSPIFHKAISMHVGGERLRPGPETGRPTSPIFRRHR